MARKRKPLVFQYDDPPPDDPTENRREYDASVDMPNPPVVIIRARVRCPNCNKWHWEKIDEVDAEGFKSGAYSLTCPECCDKMTGRKK
jgi:hypothetical protein